MARRLRGWMVAMALISLTLAAGCAGGDRRAPGESEAIALEFTDRLAPEVFTREALARRDRPKGAQGLWASVPGLRRAERGEVLDVETGGSVVVALFPGPGPATEIRLSNAAAEILGIGATPRPVKVTAIRREPRLVP